MVSLLVATEKETATSSEVTAANLYGCFGVILGLQLESMMIFLLFLLEFVLKQSDSCLQFFDGRQLLLKFLNLDIVIGCYTHRGCYSVECILYFCLVFVAAYQKTDCRILGRSLDEVINCIYIEVQLARKLRLERNGFEFDNDIAVERDMEEEHIKLSSLTGNHQLFLPAHICKTGPKFKEKTGKLFFEFCLKSLFFVSILQRNEAEVVCILSDGLLQLNLW